MIGSAQNIGFVMRLLMAVHRLCAYNYINAQNDCIFVRFIKAMLRHCAINLVYAQKLATIVFSQVTKEITKEISVMP